MNRYLIFDNLFIIKNYHDINFGHIFHRSLYYELIFNIKFLEFIHFHDESYNVVEDTMDVG